jgi:hypothetical protein
MTALQKAERAARLKTLATVRLIVENGTLSVRPRVYCERELRGHRLIPRCLTS